VKIHRGIHVFDSSLEWFRESRKHPEMRQSFTCLIYWPKDNEHFNGEPEHWSVEVMDHCHFCNVYQLEQGIRIAEAIRDGRLKPVAAQQIGANDQVFPNPPEK
jgi:hypothetical protein